MWQWGSKLVLKLKSSFAGETNAAWHGSVDQNGVLTKKTVDIKKLKNLSGGKNRYYVFLVCIFSCFSSWWFLLGSAFDICLEHLLCGTLVKIWTLCLVFPRLYFLTKGWILYLLLILRDFSRFLLSSIIAV